MVQALGAFASIRRHFNAAEISLLTTPAFDAFAKASGLFDHVRTDGRGIRLAGWLPFAPLSIRRLAIDLSRRPFDFVFDLQTSKRSSAIFRHWPVPKPNWSGIAPGCSHPHANPNRDFMHTIDRQIEQLTMAGVDEISAIDLSFATADPADFNISSDYALLVPGGAPHRPEKRWPLTGYIATAKYFAARNLTPVIVGQGAEEAGLAAQIIAAEPRARSLVGRTSLIDLAGLGRRATMAIGNDSGPIHMAAAAGTPTLALFGSDSDPALCAPRGSRTEIIRVPDLKNLDPAIVTAALSALA
jgi:ADP-heptose:LPS heptosyltransferase